MGRLSKEEEKLQRTRELNAVRVRRYKESHPRKQFAVDLSPEYYEKIDNALRERGVTKKQFLENAIDQFLKEGYNG